MKGALLKLALPGGLALACAAQVGLFSSLAGSGLPPALYPLAAGAAAMLAAPAAGLGALRSIAGLGRRDLALASLAGVMGLFLAPYLVATNRYSDAPPGTELIFFSCVLWGAVAALYGAVVLWRTGRGRGALTALSGTLAGVTGAAGVLASWERPSSFSPLVRFATEEAWMLVAGLCFVAGGALLAYLGRAHGSARPVLVSGAAAAACGLVAYLTAGAASQAPVPADRYATIALWAAAAGITWLLWAEMMRARREVAAGASLMLAPTLLSLLIFAERAVGVAGPDPLVWPGVAGGTALVAAGVAVLSRAGAADGVMSRPARWLQPAAMALCLAAAAGMFLPAISATVRAYRPAAALEAAWPLAGWETVGGWAALSCAALMLASSVDGARWAAAAALLAPAAYVPLMATPYHVLTRWLPSEVQVDFGTEYASITFKALVVWPAVVAVVGSALGLAVVLSGRARPVSDVAVDPPGFEE